MQSILERLFNGDIYPNEQIKIKLADWFSKEADVNGYYSTQAFIDGFKLGAKLMLEILEVGNDD